MFDTFVKLSFYFVFDKQTQIQQILCRRTLDKQTLDTINTRRNNHKTQHRTRHK